MIRDCSTGKTRFVFYTIAAPDGRFQGEKNIGGITHQTAMHKARQTDKYMIFSIFDSIIEDKYNHPLDSDGKKQPQVS